METIEIKSPKATACQAEVEEERPPSPNDCAICLEQLTDKSFTNSCLHMFCFHCLLAWSKVKPECPLCKQDFCSIIHNIRSMDDYDEYRVPPAAMRFPAPDSTSFLSSSLAHGSNSFLSRGHDFFSTNRRFFSYRTTLLSGGFSLPRERTSSLVIQPYVDNLQIQNDYPTVNSAAPSLIHFNRKDVYTKELEIRANPVGRHRLSSPEFYRENEGQMHRLGRWLNRELTAISQLGIQFSQSAVLSAIMEMLPQYYIQSTIFQATLFPYLGIHTRRFIREFHNFAISPFEMEEYDRSCVYVRQRTGSQLAFIVTVGGDDSEDVQVIPSQPVNHSVRPWIDFTEFRAPGYMDRMRASNAPPSCQRLLNRTSSSTTQVIDISDSENDDCVIIDEVKQTPETIVLDDSDTENGQPRVRPRSPSPKPSTSGYKPPRPPRSNSNDDDKSVMILPSSSNPEDHKPILTIASSASDIYGPLNNIFKMLSRKRSPSTSSVLSTDISVIESDAGSGTELKKRKRKCKEKPVKRSSARKKSINCVLSSSESSVSNSDDSDWEESHKRKKKVKKPDKCDKKSKKKKKIPKSPKRKKPASVEDPDDHRETHKSKHVAKKRSKKCSKETETTASGTTSFKNPYPEYDDEPAPSIVNKPKLRSVVKKVQKPLEKLDMKITSIESEEDVMPGTSFGTRNSGDRKLNSFIVRRCAFSSDSD